jgi:hypothetical protein
MKELIDFIPIDNMTTAKQALDLTVENVTNETEQTWRHGVEPQIRSAIDGGNFSVHVKIAHHLVVNILALAARLGYITDKSDLEDSDLSEIRINWNL